MADFINYEDPRLLIETTIIELFANTYLGGVPHELIAESDRSPEQRTDFLCKYRS
jgi:hypothetical protein